MVNIILVLIVKVEITILFNKNVYVFKINKWKKMANAENVNRIKNGIQLLNFVIV